MTGLCSRATIAVMGALLLVALFACSDDTEPVRLATEGTYHPFNFINDDGEIDGLERELGDELCRRAELECQWVLNDWESMIPDLVAEEFDAIIAGMSITAKRDETIDFTEPYYPPTPSVSRQPQPARRGRGQWSPRHLRTRTMHGCSP